MLFNILKQIESKAFDIYSHASLFVSKNSLLAHCQQFFEKNQLNNLVINHRDLAANRCSAKNVDILITTSAPESLYPLWQLLRWLGFHIKIVCSAHYAEQLWQTGRYRIVITDQQLALNSIPQAKLTRGIYWLGEDKPDWFTKLANSDNDWLYGQLSLQASYQQIHTEFATWFIDPLAHGSASSAPYRAIEHSLTASLPSAVDLVQYTEQQDSPLLAAFMLDYYIDLLDEYLAAIELAFAGMNQTSALQAVTQLRNVADMIAAKGLAEVLLQLEQGIQSRAWDKIARILVQVKLEITAINAYAESI